MLAAAVYAEFYACLDVGSDFEDRALRGVELVIRSRQVLLKRRWRSMTGIARRGQPLRSPPDSVGKDPSAGRALEADARRGRLAIVKFRTVAADDIFGDRFKERHPTQGFPKYSMKRPINIRCRR